ncbi:MAG: hypothetical protein Q7R57_07610, partial [Dehalococcoidales bacterium]|nr:hypothetical protein [Dehalococcoidales bacterium]
AAAPLGDYAPLALPPLSQEHMQQTGEDGKSWEGPGEGRTGRNDWMVHRFSARANYDAVAQSEQVRLALPQAEHQEDDDFFERCARRAKGEPEMPLRPVIALDREGKLTTHTGILDRGGWNNGKPVTYQVAPFKPEGLYGTRDEIERERFYIARRNEATAIQALADQEYAEQGESILRWYQQRVVSNVEALKRAIAAETCEVLTRFDDPKSGGSSFTNRVTVRPYNILRLYGIVDKETPGGMTRYAADLHSGITKRDDWKYQCIEDPAIIGRCTAVFSPVDASGIAFLAGVPVSELPDYLQHWRHSNYSLGYTGNSILNLVDPVEKLRNPWTHLNFSVQAHFSKVALNRWRRGLFRANPALAVTLYPQREPNEFLGLFA